MTAVFAADDYFSQSIPAEVRDNFDIQILYEGRPFFVSTLPKQTLDAQYTSTTSIKIYDTKWDLQLIPSRYYANTHHTVLPITILISGLLIASLLAFTTRAIQLARIRATHLAESNKLNNAIMSGAANLIIASDPQGKIIAFNKAAEKALGYSAEEIIGTYSALLWHDPKEVSKRAEEMSQKQQFPVEARLETFVNGPKLHGSETSEWTYIRKDGSRFPGNLTVTTLRNEQGDITGYVGIIQDITESKAAQERLRISEQKYRLLIDGVADYGIYWLDIDGHINSWNLGAHNLKGYTEEEVLGKHFSLFFSEEDRANGLPEHILQTARDTGKYEGSGWRFRKDGSKFWAHVLLEPIKDSEGHIIGFVKISHDETVRNEADKKLKDALQELHAILDTMVDGPIIIDQEGIVRTFTPTAERIFGYSAEEVVGQNISMLMPEPDHSKHDQYLKNFHETGVKKIIGIGREVKARHKDGSIFSMELEISEYAVGDQKRFVGIVRDVTDRKETEEALKMSKETFRAAIEHASIGMALVTPNGRWQQVNPALCDLLGYSQEELLANDFQSITHQEDLDIELNYIGKLLDDEIKNFKLEKRFYHRSGKIIWALASVSLVRYMNGEPNYLIMQIQDITEQKEIERIKSEFISIVSHELRTPLTSIRGSLGLILGVFSLGLSDKVKGLIEIAHNNCERLSLLINDILDIDKIAAGQMRFDMAPETLSDLTQHAVEANEAYAQKFGVTIAIGPIDKSIRVEMDAERYIQVLTNLISNACKFSPEGGNVEVFARRRNSHVRISVRDHGPGIAEEFRARIFGKFSQGDSSVTRTKGGTGLGLLKSRQYMPNLRNIPIMMITASDSVEEVMQGLTAGAVDYITKPFNPSELFEKVIGQIMHQQRTILIADDDETVSALLTHKFETFGCKVSSAMDGQQAWDMMNTSHYSLIVLDRTMPGYDGMTLLRMMKENAALANIPVVFLTARYNGIDIQEGLKLGSADYITKPFEPRDVVERCMKLLAA